jgi:predicted dienelactone hydrolase
MIQEYFVGSKQLQVSDKTLNISFPVLLQYPTLKASKPVAFGHYLMDVSVDAEISEGKFPLIIISHGNGGSNLLYRTISTYLVKNGYVVAMLEHYGNNRNDNKLENTIENLENRPKHVSLTIDFLLSNNWLKKSLLINEIAVIGHSMGGYTALALAGGIPRTREREIVKVTADKRIKAIVLLSPGTGWFLNSLEKVCIPILMITAEHDPITPRWNAEIVLKYISNKSLIKFIEVENAGHFSFLSPFPEKMRNPNFLPSTDPLGFDRDEFHQKLSIDILNFLDDKLKIN